MLVLWILASSFAQKQAPAAETKKSTKNFKNAVAVCSRSLYDLFEFNQDEIFVVSFFMKGDEHEKKVSELEQSFGDNKDVFDKIVYVQIDASDPYQYGGILYDLGINTATHHQFPFFLLLKDGNGQLVKGEKSVEIMHNIIEDMLKWKTSE